MNMKRVLTLSVVTVLLLFATLSTFSQTKRTPSASKKDTVASKPLVTFVELGSVNCIPCVKMQPVMRAVEEKYQEQVKVLFYDVRKPDQRQYATEYGIKLIPTQVFLDKDGKEFFRHEGFFPEEAIDDLFQKHGLKARQSK